jgi:hypothetical protein
MNSPATSKKNNLFINHQSPMSNLQHPLRNALYLLLLILAAPCARAQTKVFKAVAQDMAMQFETIRQDGNLVGYLAFNQLEKSSEDSFHYRIVIMDENLNDIGKVDFNEEKLWLKAVSFESDVLCLVYVRSNFVDKEYRNSKEFRREKDVAKAELFTQFVNLSGKILATNTVKMDIKPESQQEEYSRKVVGGGSLKHNIQLHNIPGKGFACFYGDDTKNNLLVFNTAGKLTWKKVISEDATDFTMLTSGTEVDLLIKKKDKPEEGGFEILSYNTLDSAPYPKFLLKDKKGNSLKVLAFDNDPVTGKPFVSGLIIDPVKGMRKTANTVTGLAHHNYLGIFNISLNGHTRQDIVPVFTYWADAAKSGIFDDEGYCQSARGFLYPKSCFRDHQGNTWFVGSGFHMGIRPQSIFGVAISPLFAFATTYYCIFRIKYYESKNIMMVKQDSKGALSLESTIPAAKSMRTAPRVSIYECDGRRYYTVANSDTKTDYVVMDDSKNIFIYNVNLKKIARTIPRQDKTSTISVFPAKEGSVMVSEYNIKDRTTRLSIEAL